MKRDRKIDRTRNRERKRERHTHTHKTKNVMYLILEIYKKKRELSKLTQLSHILTCKKELTLIKSTHRKNRTKKAREIL